MVTLNQGCLQRPKQQTFATNKAVYRPHVKCHIKNQAWIEREEADIDKRYNHRKSDTVLCFEKRQKQSLANGQGVGPVRINNGLEDSRAEVLPKRLTFIGNGGTNFHQVTINKA